MGIPQKLGAKSGNQPCHKEKEKLFVVYYGKSKGQRGAEMQLCMKTNKPILSDKLVCFHGGSDWIRTSDTPGMNRML